MLDSGVWRRRSCAASFIWRRSGAHVEWSPGCRAGAGPFQHSADRSPPLGDSSSACSFPELGLLIHFISSACVLTSVHWHHPGRWRLHPLTLFFCFIFVDVYNFFIILSDHVVFVKVFPIVVEINHSKAVWYSGLLLRSPSLSGGSTDKSWKGVRWNFGVCCLLAETLPGWRGS